MLGAATAEMTQLLFKLHFSLAWKHSLASRANLNINLYPVKTKAPGIKEIQSCCDLKKHL